MSKRRLITTAVALCALGLPAAGASSFGVSLGLTNLSTTGSNATFGADLRVPLLLGITVQAVGEAGGGSFTGRAFTTFNTGPLYLGPGVFYRFPAASGAAASYGAAVVAGIELDLPILPAAFVEGFGEYDLTASGAHALGARAGIRLRF